MIYLVRHGETNLNKQKKFYGSLDVSINETGIAQAMALKNSLLEVDFGVIYVSGLIRTKETARIIKDQKTATLIECSDLNEKGFGLWEGLDADEIEAAYPLEWQSWLDDPFAVNPPKAEDFTTFKERVLTKFKEISEKQVANDQEGEGSPILIVGHLGVLRIILQYVKPDIDFWDHDVPQGECVVISKALLKKK